MAGSVDFVPPFGSLWYKALYGCFEDEGMKGHEGYFVNVRKSLKGMGKLVTEVVWEGSITE